MAENLSKESHASAKTLHISTATVGPPSITRDLTYSRKGKLKFETSCS